MYMCTWEANELNVAGESDLCLHKRVNYIYSHQTKVLRAELYVVIDILTQHPASITIGTHG